MTAPKTVPARQLIYTNVEADRSPTRQRGFQIWQWSPGLAPDERRAVAKRLDDYRLPPGTAPTARPEPIDPDHIRHVFGRANGLNVIARTVPLAERDKFNRGGKFLAHAVVLSDEAFDAIGCDPFRVIDGGFPFADSPEDVCAGNANWKTGELTDATVYPSAPAEERAALGQGPVLTLLKHLEAGDDRPVALAEGPGAVRRLLRGLFAVLPAEVRRRLTFDTLTGGASLQQIKYALVGAHSPAALKLWTFRRYVRLDLATGEFAPKLDGGRAELPQALLFETGWAALPDPDRTALYEEARKLAEQRLSHLQPDRLSGPARELLASCSALEGALQMARELRVRTDVPHALSALPAVSRGLDGYLTAEPAVALARLSTAIPPVVVDDALFDEFGNDGAERPADERLCALGDRVRNGGDPRLCWIHRRWAGDLSLASVETDLADENDPLVDWRRRWSRSTLPAGVRDRGYDELVRPLSAPYPPGELVRNVRLRLALDPQPNAPEWARALLMTTALCGEDPATVVARFGGLPSHLAEWVLRIAVTRLASWEPGWLYEPAEQTFRFGLFIPEASPAVPFINLFWASAGPAAARKAFEAVVGERLIADSREAPDRIDDTVQEPTGETKKRFQAVLAARPDQRRPAVEGLRAHLSAPQRDEEYRWAANSVFEKVSAEWMWDQHEVDRFLGLSVSLRALPGNTAELFEAVAGATVTEVGKPGSGPDASTSGRRFLWAASRLTHELQTRRLKL